MAYANGVVWLKVRVGTAEAEPDEQELGRKVAAAVNRIEGVRSVSVGPTTPGHVPIGMDLTTPDKSGEE